MKLIHGMAFGALLLALGFGWGYLWPRPERAAIFQATPDLLGVDETQLYPSDPNLNVLWADGAGRGLHWRMTPDGYAALRAWAEEDE